MTMYCDGAGTNGTVSRWCIAREDGFSRMGEAGPEKTSNEMEYIAVIEALKECEDGETIYSDSRLIVLQLLGKYRVTNPNLFKLWSEARSIYVRKHADIVWISRQKNLAGNLLEGKK